MLRDAFNFLKSFHIQILPPAQDVQLLRTLAADGAKS